MTIYDALQELGVRLSAGSRWLTYEGKLFTVYERQYGSKQTRILIETTIESDAVNAFLRDGDEDAKEADALTSVIQSTEAAQ